MDGVIVFIDVGMTVLDAVLGNSPSLNFLRVFRLARLLRFVRILHMFPELSFLLRGMASSFRAIIFGTILVYIMLTMWAVVGVYWIHPVNLRVMEKLPNHYDESDRSRRAWSSVLAALVTLAQTVIFGDSWGASSIAIIEESPDTFLYFVAMYSTVALATLNLILAAIVDSGAQAREEANEERNRKREASRNEERQRKQNYLLQVCHRLDDDDSGSLSMEEIQAGFDRSKEFNTAMEEFELDRRYIDIFFNAMDLDGNGTIDYHEFVKLVDMSRTQASQNVLTFVKFAVLDARRMIKDTQTKLMQEIDVLKHMAMENTFSETGSVLSQEQQPLKASTTRPRLSAGADQQQRRVTLAANGNTNSVSVNGQTNGVKLESAQRLAMNGQTNGLQSSQKRVTVTPNASNGQSQRRRSGTIPVADSKPARERNPSPLPKILDEGPLQELVKLSREVAEGMKCLLATKDCAKLAGAAGDADYYKLPVEEDVVLSPHHSRDNRNSLLLEQLEISGVGMTEEELNIVSLKC